jgi:hypothetical protein
MHVERKNFKNRYIIEYIIQIITFVLLRETVCLEKQYFEKS